MTDSILSTQAVSIMGAGSFGTALALHIAKTIDAPVYLWSRDPEHALSMQQERENTRYLPGIPFSDNLKATSDLGFIAKSSSQFVIAVPSPAFAQTLISLKSVLNDDDIILTWATKGLDPNRQIYLSELIEEIFGKDTPMGLITGPSFALELAKGLPTVLTIASNQDKTAQTICQWFNSPTLRTYCSNDLIGAQLGGAIKNIMAIATGICDGLGLGANARAGLITRGLAEIKRYCLAMGAQESTLLEPAVLGDLILTCTDDKSRNRRLGLAIGQGQSIDEAKQTIGQEIEGLVTTKTIYTLSKRHDIYMPITDAVYHVLYENLPIKKAIEQLMTPR